MSAQGEKPPRKRTRKAFLLRTDPEILAALQRWAADELRSVNGQVEYLLRRALRQAGRFPKGTSHAGGGRNRAAPNRRA